MKLTLAQVDRLLGIYQPWIHAHYPATRHTREAAIRIVDRLLDARKVLTEQADAS